MDKLKNDLDHLAMKLKSVKDNAEQIFDDDVTENFKDIKLSIAAVPVDEKLSSEQLIFLRNTLAKSMEEVKRLKTGHRSLHGSISNVGKAISHHFVSDYSSTMFKDVSANEEIIQSINKEIAQHLQQNNLDDVADKMIQESKLPVEQENRRSKLHHISKAIREGDLLEAVEWATIHSDKLKERHSFLEFKLHQIVFLQSLDAGLNLSDLETAGSTRLYFHKFLDKFRSEIKSMMETLVYKKEISKYCILPGSDVLIETADLFLSDAYSILGIPKDSLLTVITNIGSTVLPKLLDLEEVITKNRALVLNKENVLPIGIDLDADYWYHSYFACPILRQQTSEHNPPMKLQCGHVISQIALNELIEVGGWCPYCGIMQTVNDAKRVFF